jgi:hypothetical protein
MPSVALDKAEFARPRRHDRDTGQLVSGARGLEAMIDRLVCADGSNPDPTSKFVQPDSWLHDVRPK